MIYDDAPANATSSSLIDQMYPYHLSLYVNRIMRVTPFRYYIDMLVAMLVAEKAYHQLPNFTVSWF
jgi:hypothetical protein